MSSANLVSPLPGTLTLIPTYKCTAACEHCCFQSNPQITARIAQADLLDYIDQAAALGTIHLICISGGEPFVLKDDLVELVARCNYHGIMSRIVSNASFANNMHNARRRIKAVVCAGLNEINFSTGDDHASFVDLENIVRALAVSLEFGLTCVLMIEDRIGREVTRRSILEIAENYAQLYAALSDGTIRIVESPWMPFREGGAPISQPNHRLLNKDNASVRLPCSSILTTMVVTPSHRLGVCCGLPREQIDELHAGSLRDSTMKELADAAVQNFMNIWLFVEGPERILAWAASKCPDIQWENRYAHNCDACRALFHDAVVRRTILQHWKEKYEEVMMKFALFEAGDPVPKCGGQQEPSLSYAISNH